MSSMQEREMGEGGTSGGDSSSEAVNHGKNKNYIKSDTIFHAARSGDADFIQAAIMNGADVNQRDSDGER